MLAGCSLAVCILAAWAASPNPHASRVYAQTWSIGGDSAPEWTQDAGPIDASRAYNVECQFTLKRGTAWLKAVAVDAQGGTVAEAVANQPMQGDASRWFAIQLPPAPGAVALRVSGGGDANATFHNLRVLPYSPSILGNATFALPLDQKNRIPLWNEETGDSIMTGARGGAIALDTAQGHLDPGSITLTPSQVWCAVSSLNYPVPAWSDRFRGEAWALASAGAQARAALVWSDDAAVNVLRIDVGEPVTGDGWQRVTTPVLSPPDGANMVRLVCIASGGAVTFDDADFITELPDTPVMRVLVNQAGYDIAAPKSAVVMTNTLTDPAAACTATLVAADASRPMQCDLRYAGRIVGNAGADWGWHFWRVDFDDAKVPGPHTIQVALGELHAESRPFELASNRLFYSTANACVDFFYVQRCGGEVAGWHRPCHMDDAKLPDGTHRDLTGGWHSAGDYNKITWEYGDGGVMYALATLLDTSVEFCARFNRDEEHYEDAMDEAMWGAAYLGKQQMDNGGFFKDIQQGPDKSSWMKWSPPDSHTDNVRGTPDDPVVMEGEGHSPLAIGAWARLHRILKEREHENDYLDRAIRAWNHATPGAEGDPLLLISTVDLYNVTRDDQHLAFARASVEKILASAPQDGLLGGGYANSGDVPAAALAHFAAEMPGDPLKSRIRQRLKSHLDAILAEPDNAFGIPRQQFGPDGFYFEPTSALGHNYEYLCRAWSALKIYRVLREAKARDYAFDQLNFVLGVNPYDLCMMEGVGAVNAPRYHHRYKTIPGHDRGAVPGAIPNGFVRDIAGNDRPGFDLSMAGREYPSYRTNEPWLVHNVFYLLTVSALHEAE